MVGPTKRGSKGHSKEWRKETRFGHAPEHALFVKCNFDVRPAEGIDAGQVMCQVGAAPVKPAEFIIFLS